MGFRYLGGPSRIVDAPRHDLTEADFSRLSAEVREAVAKSSIYQRINDAEVRPVGPVSVLDSPAVSRVMVVTPTHRLEPETVRSIFAMTTVGPTDYFFTRDNPFDQGTRKGYYNIEHNLKKARALFLKGNYEAMLIVESDMIVPPDTIERLSRIDADVAGGLYFMRHGPNGTPNAFEFVQGFPDDLSATIRPRDIATGRVLRTNGVCMGVVLIRRHVIKSTPFRLSGDDSAAPDWAFMIDCNRAGYVTAVDTSLHCGHIRPDRVAYWPTPEGYGREVQL